MSEHTWVAGWQPEDAPLLAARQRAEEVGVRPVDPVTGAALRLLGAASRATHAVEVGTGTGVATLWLLRGLPEQAQLTSIDSEPEHQRLAKLALAEAEIPPARVRLIAGNALDVMPRLSDGGYDLAVCDGAASEAQEYLTAAKKLLRPGGIVAFTGALAGGRVADPSVRDSDTVAARELARTVRDDPELIAALFPIGAGLLAAVKVVPPAEPAAQQN